MGALAPVLTTALVSQGVGFVTNELSRQSSRKAEQQALSQLQQRQALQQQQAEQDATLRRDSIALDTRQTEENRKAALRRAVARQRANFSAQGIGAGQGSSQAVLLGLFDESDDEKRRREELDGLRLNAIDQDLAQGRSLNVLQRTQLAERNRLKTQAGFVQTGSDVLRAGAGIF